MTTKQLYALPIPTAVMSTNQRAALEHELTFLNVGTHDRRRAEITQQLAADAAARQHVENFGAGTCQAVPPAENTQRAEVDWGALVGAAVVRAGLGYRRRVAPAGLLRANWNS